MKTPSKKRKSREKSDDDEDQNTSKVKLTSSLEEKSAKSARADEKTVENETEKKFLANDESVPNPNENENDQVKITAAVSSNLENQDNLSEKTSASVENSIVVDTKLREEDAKSNELLDKQSPKSDMGVSNEKTNEPGQIERPKTSGKSVRFTNVKVFEFERCQGFSSIPGNFAPFNETITLGI